MQIELIGCTSAGKSTLAKKMLEAYRARGDGAVMKYDFVLGQVRLNWIRNFMLRTFVLDLIALSGCVASWRRNREFRLFALRHIRRLPATVGVFEKLNIGRNVLKHIGIHEIIRRRAPDQQIVIIDEGTLHIAHALFVHVSVEPEMSNMSAFAGLVPLPDIAVYVQQDESVLITRTLARTHKRIPNNTYDDVSCFIKQAVNIFDNLVQHSELKKRALMVLNSRGENIDTQELQVDETMDAVSEIVRTGLRANESTTKRGC